jgi:dihydrofolate reductase
MTKLRCGISMSLDGFIAGPNPSEEHPLGEGGMQLHEWIFKLAAWRAPHGLEGGEVNTSSAVVEDALHNIGATVMGRKMFGGGTGPWDEESPWMGWWEEEPPFHTPVFVLTHHAREPLEMKGGTTFFFVTEGIASALGQATEAAGSGDVKLAGGADVAQQFLTAGLLDELQLSVVPVLLGAGTRLLENLPGADIELRPTAVVEAPEVTHITYEVHHQGGSAR